MKTYVTKKEREGKRGAKRPGEVFNPAHTSLLTKSPHKFNLSNETQMKFGA